RGEPVHAHAAPGLGDAPLRGDRTLAHEALQRRIQRSRLHLEHVARAGADQLHDAVAVARPPAQRLEDDEIKRALEDLNPRGRCVTGHSALGRVSTYTRYSVYLLRRQAVPDYMPRLRHP